MLSRRIRHGFSPGFLHDQKVSSIYVHVPDACVPDCVPAHLHGEYTKRNRHVAHWGLVTVSAWAFETEMFRWFSCFCLSVQCGRICAYFSFSLQRDHTVHVETLLPHEELLHVVLELLVYEVVLSLLYAYHYS